MKISNLICSIFLLASICTSCKIHKNLGSTEDMNAINLALSAQQKAWNQGNLDAFMEGYWNDEAMSFVGKSGVNYGWTTTLNNYKKGYPDIDAMGKLHFDVIELRPLSHDAYYMLGQFTLTRKTDKPTGYFSLIWQKIDGQWLITSDHTSG